MPNSVKPPWSAEQELARVGNIGKCPIAGCIRKRQRSNAACAVHLAERDARRKQRDAKKANGACRELFAWIASTGQTNREIAKRLGITETSLNSWLHEHTIPPPELARLIQEVTGVVVSTWKYTEPTRFSYANIPQADKEAIWKEYSEGWNRTSLAKRFQRSSDTITRILAEAGYGKERQGRKEK